MTTAQSTRIPASLDRRTFHAPEIWLILQVLGAAPTDQLVPADASFNATAVEAARTELIRNKVFLRDTAGGVRLADSVDALVRPAAYPQVAMVANVTDRGPASEPSKMICFSRAAETIVVNWVDEQGDHHFVAYSREEAQRLVLYHLMQACDWNIDPPDPSAPAPTPRDVERAAEHMKQAVSLMAVTQMGTPDQTVRAISWFLEDKHAWLMLPPTADGPRAPQRASQTDVARAVLEFAAQTFKTR